jgi:DinB superfamily
MAEEAQRQIAPTIIGALDYVWSRITDRLTGLTAAEYRWEPVDGCWSVRPAGDGRWEADRPAEEPDPPPVTTIAWRLWHIGSQCLAGFTARGLGPWPLEVSGRAWYGDPEAALAATEQAWQAFRAGLVKLGEDGMWQQLGPDWGPYATDTWTALALHVMDEIVHHGAEIALLRDLYPRLTAAE